MERGRLRGGRLSPLAEREGHVFVVFDLRLSVWAVEDDGGCIDSRVDAAELLLAQPNRGCAPDAL